MDVVRTNIEKIGGTIEMSSVAGKGTSFTIKIPLTLAIVSALVVESFKERFAVPQINVVELVRTSPRSETRIEMINASPVLRLRNRLLPLVSLRKLLAQEGTESFADSELFIVVTQVGTYNFGIIVDRVFDTEEIVVKPVSPLLREIPFYAGNTILGDGSVIMILDPNGIAAAAGQVASAGKDEKQAVAATHEEERMSFLVFRAGAAEFKAVPLALVARLEEIDARTIERTRGRHVVQYRDHLMPLVPFDAGHQWKTEGKQPILVFSEGERSMGLVVDEIVDVVADVMKVELNSSESGLVGSAVIGGKAMDIIDVGNYLTRAYADWFTPEATQATPAVKSLRRALVIDHSPFVRDLLTPHLAGAGWHVTTAATGADAQRLTETDAAFGLVVAGLDTPGFDAAAFAQRLRADPNWSAVKLASIAEDADDEENTVLRAAGFDLCLTKSDWSGLVDELRGLIADAASELAAAAEPASADTPAKVVRVRKRAARTGRRTAQKLAAE
jgi:two-component system chemotaxis sensor kinase CheA